MRIDDFHWVENLVDKIVAKHGVDPEEVESALLNDDPLPYVWGKGNRYLALAQVEDDGEYLFIVFAMETGNVARIITARPMEPDEKSKFRRVRKQA